jgi:hypothetical protein
MEELPIKITFRGLARIASKIAAQAVNPGSVQDARIREEENRAQIKIERRALRREIDTNDTRPRGRYPKSTDDDGLEKGRVDFAEFDFDALGAPLPPNNEAKTVGDEQRRQENHNNAYERENKREEKQAFRE